MTSRALKAISDAPSHTWLHDWLNSTEAAFDLLLQECSAVSGGRPLVPSVLTVVEVGPPACALAKKQGEDPQAIWTRASAFLDHLYHHPLPVPHAQRPGMLTSGLVRGTHLHGPLSNLA